MADSPASGLVLWDTNTGHLDLGFSVPRSPAGSSSYVPADVSPAAPPAMVTYVLLGLVALVSILAIVIATRPAAFAIERSTTVAAPPGAVIELIEDFNQWKRWSPWDKLDPTQVVTVSGAPRGKGAMYAWVGQKNGQGRMEILEHRPNEFVGIQLDFLKPMTARNRCDFTVRPTDKGTVVVWRMTGTHSFTGKAFAFFASMDKLVGRDFERGLADMKAVAEVSVGARGGSHGASGGVRSPA